MGDVLPDHIANGIAFQAERAAVQVGESSVSVECAWTAPHVLMRPRVYPDGDRWCALYGDNLQDGVAGFGDSPADACTAFDKAWRGEVSRG